VPEKNNRTGLTWYTMDLHLHTPASEDYLQPEIGYLDILKQAENKGLDIIAFTDHNTVAGYRRMQEEIEQLKLLQQLNRLLPEEETRLTEYQRLLKRVLVLPGFEFTATFGFHILAIFPEDKPVRDIEHLLLELNIPSEKLDVGSVTVGASVDVLTASNVMCVPHRNINNNQISPGKQVFVLYCLTGTSNQVKSYFPKALPPKLLFMPWFSSFLGQPSFLLMRHPGLLQYFQQR